ncbi:FtsJ-domain-containing protein [Pluteus cervinus]|uniref:FtsJ-domain-containing protein n=1 Tax=Pluteus cervinus TaxID=181527 RepID=A0ACD3AHW3_9AGAR|nr:FtsJ-domain-containing protein [Pluteus cervinus]
MPFSFHATARLLSSSKRKSSAAWLARQSRDPYVKLRNSSIGSGSSSRPFPGNVKDNSSRSPTSRKTAWKDGPTAKSGLGTNVTSSASYRSRSAFKLLEMNQLAGGFLTKKDVKVVVDLGAAPGGWSQVVAQLWGESGSSTATSADFGEDVGELAEQTTEELRGEEEPDEGDLVADDEDLPRSTRRALKKPKKSKLSNPDLIQETEEDFDPLNIEDLSLYSGSFEGTDGPLIIAIDLLQISPLHGVHTIQGDFLLLQEEDEHRLHTSSTEALEDHDSATYSPGISSPSTSPQAQTHSNSIQSLLGPKTKVDVILSDMAANLSGNKDRDVQSSLDICCSVLEFAKRRLRTANEIGRRKGGVLLIKHFTHPLLHEFRTHHLVPNFHDVRYIKPDSSRSDSSEAYYLCQGWKGIV